MITKTFTTKKEIKDFKDKYSNGDIETEVISNLIQPYHAKKSPLIEKYCDFWWPSNNEDFGLLSALKLTMLHYANEALESEFGKYDFKFQGNRDYYNHILSFNNLTFIAPSKLEVVIERKKSANFYENIIAFEQNYYQLILNYIFKNEADLPDYKLNSLMALKDKGIIDSNNQINFEYYLNKPKKIYNI